MCQHSELETVRRNLHDDMPVFYNYDFSFLFFNRIDANARALGCNLTKKKVGEEQRFFAILKVPLTFPVPRNKLRRQ